MSATGFDTLVARFSVLGVPIPQGSMTARVMPHAPMIREGRCVGGVAPLHASNRAALDAWRAIVRGTASTHWGRRAPLRDAVEIAVTFYGERPASAAKRRYPIARSFGDIDKLERAILDALTADEKAGRSGILADDSIVVGVYATKRYGPSARTEIAIYTETEAP